VEIYIRGFY